jgi:LPS sulfotransferase NodH
MKDVGRPPMPVVVGCIRSGTTLMRAMLGAHPALAMPPETEFIVTLADRHERGLLDVDAFIADLEADPNLGTWSLDLGAVRDALLATRAPTYADGVRAVHHVYASAHGKPRWGSKMPSFVRHLERIRSVLPEAVFLHVVRDGRDVVPAIVKAPFGPRTNDEAAVMWATQVRAGIDAGARLGDGYLEIRYEELVADPASVLAEVCGELALDFDDAMLHPEVHADAMLASARHPGAHTSLHKPITNGLRNWRTDLTDSEVARIELLAGDVLLTAGYERRFPRVPAWARVQVRTSAVRRAARRRASRALKPVRARFR